MKKLALVFLTGALAFGITLTAQDKKAAGKKGGAGDAAKGEAVLKDKNCGVCHFTDKTERRIGPGFKGLFTHTKMWDDKPFSEAAVREMIMKGGGKMTGFEDQLNNKDLDNLIAYLKTL